MSSSEMDSPGGESDADKPESSPPDRQHTDPQHAVEKGPTFAAPEARVHDLSPEIVSALPRAAGERVTCRRIYGDHYRCNWWSRCETGGYDNPEMGGMTVTTHRVIRSEMLHVTKTKLGLQIKPGPSDRR